MDSTESLRFVDFRNGLDILLPDLAHTEPVPVVKASGSGKLVYLSIITN